MLAKPEISSKLRKKETEEPNCSRQWCEAVYLLCHLTCSTFTGVVIWLDSYQSDGNQIVFNKTALPCCLSIIIC